MKIWAYIAFATILTGFLTWGYNAVYQAGADNERVACSAEREKTLQEHTEALNSVIERERQANQAAEDIARAHYATIITEVEKNALLQKRLSENPAVKCVEDMDGNSVAHLSFSTIRVLNDCSQAVALPEAAEKQGFITENEVTAADLAAYTCFAVSQYNRCAIEVNSAIDERGIK